MNKIIYKLLKRTLINWKNPRYFDSLFLFSKRYLDFWYGDNNFDRKTNGENRILEILAPNIKLVVDVGANIGEYSQYILTLAPGAIIHSFEPDPIAYKELSKIAVTANNIALSDAVGRKDFFLGERSTHNSFYNVEQNKGKISVYTDTLDGYVKKSKIAHIDFLKIDTEGSEYSVLLGAKNILYETGIDFIQFEFSGANIESRVFLKDFIGLFNKVGYDLYRIKPKSIEKILWRPDKERFTLTNYLAINKNVRAPKELNAREERF